MPRGIPGSGPNAKKRKAGTARRVVSKRLHGLSMLALHTTPLANITFGDVPQLVLSGALVIHDKVVSKKQFLRGED